MLVIVSILAWFATACVLNTLVVDYDFFMVRGKGGTVMISATAGVMCRKKNESRKVLYASLHY